jgi:DNA invertase Pin-like site-specific DNA recombinase
MFRASQNIVSKRVGYCRVSTTDQTNDQQKDALVAAGCGVIWSDEGISGSVRDRKGLDAALADCHTGDTLVVVALDRLGRDLGDLVAIVNGLREQGVNLVCLRESIDTSTDIGQMLLGIFGALAQYERALIRERTAARLGAKKRRGENIGRKPSLTPSQVVSARTLLDAGTSAATVARNLGCSRATLYRHLSGSPAA